jgi:hypothetical protein
MWIKLASNLGVLDVAFMGESAGEGEVTSVDDDLVGESIASLEALMGEFSRFCYLGQSHRSTWPQKISY